MKKYILPLIFTLVSSLGFTATHPNEAYDSDLFNKDNRAFIVSGEFLYWTVEEGSLDYALTMKQAAPNGTTYAQGNYKNGGFGWDPGFRVCLGYYNAPKFWEAKTQYTYMRSTGSDSASDPTAADQYIIATFPEITTSSLARATSSIRLNYDLGDLLVDRVFLPNPHLKLRLFGGPTGGRIRQNWRVKYFTANDATKTDVVNRWKYYAGGLRLGLDLDWFWGNCVYLTGAFSSGALIGRYTNHAAIVETNSPASPYMDTNFKDWRAAYNVQFLFGPSVQKGFQTWRFELFAGYELNSWFNLHEVYRSTGSSSAYSGKYTRLSNGVTSFHGLDVRLSFYF